MGSAAARSGWRGVKVRLVKGANLAMERVDAELHGWPAAPFATKDETDANYKRMLDVLLDPANDGAVRLGVASHNVFEVAWAVTRASAGGVAIGSTSKCLRAWRRRWPRWPPTVLAGCDCMRPLHPAATSKPPSPIWAPARRKQRTRQLPHPLVFPAGWLACVGDGSRPLPDLGGPPPPAGRADPADPETGRYRGRATPPGAGFANEPDTDFSIAANRDWITGQLASIRKAGVPDYGPVVAGRTVNGAATESAWTRARAARRLTTGSRPTCPWWRRRWRPPGGGGRVGRDPVGGAAPDPRRCGRRPGPPTRRASGRDGRRRRQNCPRGRSGGVGSDRLRRLLRRPHPRDRQRVSTPRDRRVASPWNFPLSIPAGGLSSVRWPPETR